MKPLYSITVQYYTIIVHLYTDILTHIYIHISILVSPTTYPAANNQLLLLVKFTTGYLQ